MSERKVDGGGALVDRGREHGEREGKIKNI